MKLFYFFLLCFINGINPTKGQLHQETRGILLRFVFHQNYYFYEKSCCKFISHNCLTFVTSRGFVSNAYKGRLETYHYFTIFDVRILNVHEMDAGLYRCALVQRPDIYMNFQVDIAGSPVLNPTFAFPKSTISPVSSAHNLLENQKEKSNNKWRSKFTLGAISGVVVIILILFITLSVFYYKKKSRDKCGTNLPSSPNITHQPPQELIYTAVDFKHHQKTSNIYENLDIHNSISDSDNAVKTHDSVEYATISRIL